MSPYITQATILSPNGKYSILRSWSWNLAKALLRFTDVKMIAILPVQFAEKKKKQIQ